MLTYAPRAAVRRPLAYGASLQTEGTMADLLRSLCVRLSAYADVLSPMRSRLPNVAETKPVELE